jgi:hypothetical protein
MLPTGLILSICLYSKVNILNRDCIFLFGMDAEWSIGNAAFFGAVQRIQYVRTFPTREGL